jgi:hypothetical protein
MSTMSEEDGVALKIARHHLVLACQIINTLEVRGKRVSFDIALEVGPDGSLLRSVRQMSMTETVEESS